MTGSGLPEDFYRLLPRLARRGDHLSAAVALTFVAFDVLWLDDEPVTTKPYLDRRRLFEDLDATGPAWVTVPAFQDSTGDVVEASTALGLEGIVAKRVDSPCRPGKRSNDWLKVKTTAWKALHRPRRHEHV